MILIKLISLMLLLPFHSWAAPFIIRGEKAGQGEFPWQVSLQNNDGHFCGGSILSKRFILTASHCLIVSNIKVYAGGDGSIWKLKKLSPIKNISLHSNWITTRRLNDIGLIELSEDIPFSEDIKPIPLASEKDFKKGAKAIVSGYGVVVDPNLAGEINFASWLQKAELVLAPQFTDSKYWAKELSTYYTERYDEYKTNAFADVPKRRLEERKGGCYADSGGPLVVQDSAGAYRLLGIVSKLIDGCGISTIFTSVPAHLNWIKEKSK